MFIIATSIFLSVPKFFNYEEKKEIIKKYLINYYDLELKNYSSLKYNIFPLPNLLLTNVDFKIRNKTINIKSNDVKIFLNLKNIYNYENLKIKKVLLNESNILLETDRTKDLLEYFKKLKNQLIVKNLNLKLINNNNSLLSIKNVTFSNYGRNRYKINGQLFGKKFQSSLTNNDQRLNFKLLKTGIKANFEFNNKKSTNLITGSSKINLLKSLLRFNFLLDNSQVEIVKSNFRNEKLSFSFDSLVKFNPYFSISSIIDINEIDKDLIYSANLDIVLKNKEFLKKLNNKIKINYKNKRLFSNIINKHTFNANLSYGRIFFSNKIYIAGGEINCSGESILIEKFPRLDFICLINLENKKKLFKKFSMYKNINNEALNLNVEGSLNLINRKINFTRIDNNKNYKANEEDIKYFKEKFENILFNDGFFKIFNKNKIKNFLLEIV